MQHDFWLERWQQQKIGFHQTSVNPFLTECWSSLGLDSQSRVFVPLCGKSTDMLWLGQQGFQVIGNELSELAIDAFWAEHSLVPERSHNADFNISEFDSLQLLQGDFFALSPSILGNVDAVFDRASLVALPLQMRLDYVKVLRSLLPSGAKILLVTLEKELAEEKGPPFNISIDDVNHLYANDEVVHLLSKRDALSRDFAFTEHVFSITIVK